MGGHHGHAPVLAAATYKETDGNDALAAASAMDTDFDEVHRKRKDTPTLPIRVQR